jgi:hypothetical protein
LALIAGRRGRLAVDLLLCGLAKAELESGGPARVFHETLREDILSPFLKIGLKFLDEYQPADLGEQQEDL